MTLRVPPMLLGLTGLLALGACDGDSNGPGENFEAVFVERACILVEACVPDVDAATCEATALPAADGCAVDVDKAQDCMDELARVSTTPDERSCRDGSLVLPDVCHEVYLDCPACSPIDLWLGRQCGVDLEGICAVDGAPACLLEPQCPDLAALAVLSPESPLQCLGNAVAPGIGDAFSGWQPVVSEADPEEDFSDSESDWITQLPGPVLESVDLQRTLGFSQEEAETWEPVFDALYGPSGMFGGLGAGVYYDMVPATPGRANLTPVAMERFQLEVRAAVPLASPDRSYIYSFVFDTDGDSANDWRAQPPFDHDYFQGTDRWFQLTWDHQQQDWSLQVSVVRPDQTIESVSDSEAVAVVGGSTVLLWAPESEVGTDGGFRASAFVHDGRYTKETRGGDVTGEDATGPLLQMP